MSRTAYKFSAVIVSLLLAVGLAACGSDHREANANPASVARVADEGTCRVCHSTTLDPVSGRPLLADFLTATDSHNQAGRVDGATADLGCQGCHGGGAEHNGVGPIPFPNPLNIDGNGTTRCIACHTAGGLDDTSKDLTQLFALARDGSGGFVGQCARCHTSPDNGLPSNPVPGPNFNVGVRGVHGANLTDQNCVTCHSIVQNGPQHGAAQVNDNSGVRAVTTEFAKWSHHVTGVTLNPAHCAACHLEGTVESGAIIVDKTKHMADAQVHLRNVADDTEFLWDPAAPNHTNMDNFCMSCHSAAGATSPVSAQIQAIINGTTGLAAVGKTASALNPFGDTISNRYDKMFRPRVTNVGDQFNTTNNSHHGVKGPRYSGRTRVAGARQIASSATFASNSSALLQGQRSTIYDAGNFNSLYVPLANAGGEAAPRTGAASLGDDSTLHCGDCHTVGQWKPGTAVTFTTDGSNGTVATNLVSAAIGAHGSNNEYLLRNFNGTDARHTARAYLVGNAAGTVLNPFTGLPIPNGAFVYTNPNSPFLVCYNCHNIANYGAYLATGLNGGNAAGSEVVGNIQAHAGEYDETARCNGAAETIPFGGYTTGKATDGTQFSGTNNTRLFGTPGVNSAPAPYPGEQALGGTDGGDIFGIQCLNCHNSGIGNAYGGIHGSANNTSWNDGVVTHNPDPSITGGAYIDGLGNTTKVERFLPGLGDAQHVPGTLGGYSFTTASPGATVSLAAGAIPGARSPSPSNAYSYTTNAITKDTNWEQKFWQQAAGTVFNYKTGVTTGNLYSGAGCYTLGTPATVATNVTAGLSGPSVTGAGGTATALYGTWGGCTDHTATQGEANHGFLKRIIRPVTY